MIQPRREMASTGPVTRDVSEPVPATPTVVRYAPVVSCVVAAASALGAVVGGWYVTRQQVIDLREQAASHEARIAAHLAAPGHDVGLTRIAQVTADQARVEATLERIESKLGGVSHDVAALCVATRAARCAR